MFQGCSLLEKDMHTNCQENNVLQWISVSPNYQEHFVTHLLLSPSFIFGTFITIRWVKIFIILVENSRENRSTYVCVMPMEIFVSCVVDLATLGRVRVGLDLGLFSPLVRFLSAALSS